MDLNYSIHRIPSYNSQLGIQYDPNQAYNNQMQNSLQSQSGNQFELQNNLYNRNESNNV